ncbi:MAG: thioredoxin family protein [Bacteroidaceae bacterium]|nr:thioredoxin family protein [Bacteroidaceae bacterium]
MKRFYSILILALMAATAVAQVNFTVSYKRVSPTEIDIIFNGKADKGWHVYGCHCGGDGPNPAIFGTDKAKGAKVKGALKDGPGIKKAYDEMFGQEIQFFEGKAQFTQRVELTEKNYELEGYLQFSACNDETCLPPTDVMCKLKGSDGPDGKAAVEEPEEKAAEAEQPAVASDSLATDSLAAAVTVDEGDAKGWWTSSIDELKKFDIAENAAGQSLWMIFLLGILGGLVALITPCVWPIIPMTVSFFLKRSDDKKKGIKDAIIYGISIVVIYLALGLTVTALFGASALNDLSTNAVFNIFFFLMLLAFGASFLGGFEITLPSSWSNAIDGKAEKASGLLAIFLMAFTLTLVSFSCTGPIIGFLLVEVSTGGGGILAPTIGMLGFALALALPFTLFAMFPALLKKTSRGGSWMNRVKVTLGFIELAFSLKFLSVADLAYGWHILDRETFLALWIGLFAALGLYLWGLIKFPHDDEDERHTSVTAFFIGLASIAFAIYMVPGLWGAPCKACSAFAPPITTQDFNLDQNKVEAQFRDYEAGMAYAKQTGKPVMLDFTGHGCVNCRKMELAVWHDASVRDMLMKDYVLISLYVDEKTPLPETITVNEDGKEVRLRTIGDRWSYLQRMKFGCNAQPYYFILDNDGHVIAPPRSYNEDVPAYTQWLKEGLVTYKNAREAAQ